MLHERLGSSYQRLVDVCDGDGVLVKPGLAHHDLVKRGYTWRQKTRGSNVQQGSPGELQQAHPKKGAALSCFPFANWSHRKPVPSTLVILVRRVRRSHGAILTIHFSTIGSPQLLKTSQSFVLPVCAFNFLCRLNKFERIIKRTSPCAKTSVTACNSFGMDLVNQLVVPSLVTYSRCLLCQRGRLFHFPFIR